jgi:hypothetical protein
VHNTVLGSWDIPRSNMNDQTTIEPHILIEEHYSYNVRVGTTTFMQPTTEHASVTVTVPYDGRFLDHQTAQETLTLGTITITQPDEEAVEPTPIDMPAGAALLDHAKSGRALVWKTSYHVPTPIDTLLAISGTVVDGADIDLRRSYGEDDLQQRYAMLGAILFGRTEEFVNNLRLRLDLWAPLLSDTTVVEDEIRDRLLQLEHTRQVVLPRTQTLPLAEHMAALANSGGGQILLGVDNKGAVVGVVTGDAFELEVLLAAYHVDPPVRYVGPDYYATEQGVLIARIMIPEARQQHTIGGKRFQRQGTATVATAGAGEATPAFERRPVGDARALLGQGNSESVAIIDALGSPIDKLELGPYMSGLYNGSAHGGMIIIRNLLPKAEKQSNASTIHQTLLKYLEEERQRCRPTLPELTASFVRFGGNEVAIIQLPRGALPFVLYSGEAYTWNGQVLQRMEPAETIVRGLRAIGGTPASQESMQAVELVQGLLRWPVQPPLHTKSIGAQVQGENATTAGYVAQQQAFCWDNVPFLAQESTGGFECRLVASLRQAFVNIDAQEAVEKPLHGTLTVRFDHVLASRSQVTLNADHRLLEGIPVQKRTYVHLNLFVRTNQLFHRRSRTALLHFQVPEVSFSGDRRDRLTDLKQAFADLEFWIERDPPLIHGDGSGPLLFTGMRSKDYFDIHLIAGITYEPISITREIRYPERTDSKQVETGLLDIRLLLTGEGNDVKIARATEDGVPQREVDITSEIARLQLRLSELIEERLTYLRTV